MSHKPPKGRPLGRSRVRATGPGPRIPAFALVIGALVVVVVAAGVALAVRGGGDAEKGTLAPGDQAFGPVAASGTPLPEYDEAGEDPAVGQPAPTLDGETPSGDPVTIDPSQGPMVVAFLAHWCRRCQAEVPRIVDLAGGSDEIEGVPFVAVLTGSAPEAPNFPPGEWLAEEGWPAPVMVDTEPEPGGIPVAFSAYGAGDAPFLVAVDADGNVAARASGELGEDGLREFFAQVS